MEIVELNAIHDLAGDPIAITELGDALQSGSLLIARSALDPGLSAQLVQYLKQVGASSLPTYAPIEVGAPNGHRLNREDERAYVMGCFHQFVFYPWNQDIFDLFELLRPVYRLKNALSGNHPDRYLSRTGEDGVVARLAFQFYPAGSGFLARHRDPSGEHQATVPTVTLSTKGVDFVSGGAYLEDLDGTTNYLDDLTKPGDVVFFGSDLIHGVDIIDENQATDWLAFQGRWSLLIATNKIVGMTDIADAVELGRQT